MKTVTTALVALAMLATGLVVSAAPGNADGAALAQGGFQFIGRNGALRTMEFTATRDASNNQRGNGHLFNHVSGVNIRFEIDCLHVSGNVATMSGTIVDPVGGFDYMWMQVIDNGEGSKSPPDLTSGFYAMEDSFPCTIDTGTSYSDNAVTGGNIQVR
jgi:hypothetical protein